MSKSNTFEPVIQVGKDAIANVEQRCSYLEKLMKNYKMLATELNKLATLLTTDIY